VRPADRPVLVTGCSSGIGLAAARRLRDRGYPVFASARRDDDLERLRGEGLQAVRLDLDDDASIGAALDAVLERTGGRLYGLFNNGAYGQPGAVEDLRRDVLRAQLETALLGWHELTRRAIPVMRAQGEGRIIQNSSVLGLVAFAYRGAYVATKFALEGLTDTLRLELHGTGIQVSLIEPGPILSRFRENAFRKFVDNVDVEASPHRDRYRAMQARLTKEGPAQPFTLPPDAVVRRVIHALEARRAKARYYVTLPTYLFAALRRVLPTIALDALLRAASGGGRR
jgi:NAD(P)-dependent dehydrogenase (short-subunit alcohol dehydrogenase family)